MKHNICYLFLRGLARNQFHWGDPTLYKSFLGPHVYFIDLPGFGINNHLKPPHSIHKTTDFVKKEWTSYVQNQNIGSYKKVLVSLSLGGMVGMDWCSRYPQDWDQLILINSSAGDLNKFWHRLKPQNYLKLFYSIVTPCLKARESCIFDMTCNDQGQKGQRVKEWVQVAKQRPIKYSNLFLQLWAALRFRSPDQIQTSGVVLSSLKDKLVSYKCSENISKKYNFKLIHNKTAGHDLSVDHLEWMFEKIREHSLKTEG